MDERARGWAKILGIGLVVGLGACGSDGSRADDGDGDSTISASGEDGIDTLDSGGDKFDVAGGSGDDGGDNMGGGCKKVDLLFVIDNSGSMADEQANLVAAFPGFINAMRTQLASTDGYNVGVITSDAYIADIACLQEGTLVTSTLGPDSSNAMCAPYSSGGRYMTQDDDLNAKFSCAAQVGTGGDGNERPMQALQAALANAQAGGAGPCSNAGFLRDDAILVVVLITDEEDDHEVDGCDQLPQPGSAGDPQAWYDAVVAAKGNAESSVVVLSLVGPDDDQCPALDKCNGGIIGAEVATRILDFTRRFTFGFVGRVCDDYEPFFTEAVGVIKSACDDFVPPG